MSRLDGESDEQFRKRHVAKEPLSVSSVCVCFAVPIHISLLAEKFGVAGTTKNRC